jgi:hypothetical protein
VSAPSAATPDVARRERSVPGAHYLVAELVQRHQLVRGKLDIESGHILFEPPDPLGPGNRDKWDA